MNQADIDQMARDLYSRLGICWECRHEYTLSDGLLFICPHCGEKILPSIDEMTREQGKELLATLRQRREELRAAGLLEI